MDRLIVSTKNAPISSVNKILATWGKLAELLENRAQLQQRCFLEWDMVLQKYDEGVWGAYAGVRMISIGQFGGISDATHKVSVPLTEVSEIMIYEDGTFSWHSERFKPENADAVIIALEEAVCVGKHNGYFYRKNWFPFIER
ncbi:MAG: hypothetical protein NTV02_03530 [Candidatus Zambryskibacteria bacterium]|nr:hypothetical protein [Candidatus Zambryskibacteria bacterium]